MHNLPPVNHPARDMFDIESLVAIGTGQETPLTLIQAKARGKRLIADAKGAVRRACYFVIRHDDSLELVSVGARGGHKTEWVF